MSKSSDERDIRIEKLKKIKDSGIIPFIDRGTRTHTLDEAGKLKVGTKDVELCGRLMLKRVFGKLIFATLQDFSGRLQIALNVSDISNEDFKFFQKMVDVLLNPAVHAGCGFVKQK